MMNVKEISGGVTAAKGFVASGLHCGIRANKEKKDVALIVSACDCAAAGVFTKNIVKAAPVYKTLENLKNGRACAIICNSGNANACAPNGMENAQKMCEAVADALEISADDVIVSSTGVIGVEMDVSPIENHMGSLMCALSADGSDSAAAAIMTTDLAKKELAVEFSLGGKTVRIGGIAKGSGMIHPNMGTMLGFITTDAAISSEMLSAALQAATRKTFNRVTVDGDTSTNDMVCTLANGMAQNAQITAPGADFDIFSEALVHICTYFARAIAKDGEGATKLLTCTVAGAQSEESAETISKSVIASSLVKSAMFGSDANWGRIICAMGYSGESFTQERASIAFSSGKGELSVFENGQAVAFSEDRAKDVLSADEVLINITLGDGGAQATCWGCDLTYDYVKINGDYRS